MNHSSKKSYKRKIVWVIVLTLVAAAFVTVFMRKVRGNNFETEMKCYEKEMKRFEKMLQEAPDEERFLMLRYALYNHYLPVCDPDPYYFVFCGVAYWSRTQDLYGSLSNREDLLCQIYPDVKKLEEYVNSNRFYWDDDNVAQDSTFMAMRPTIESNLEKDSLLFQSMERPPRKLIKKYFGTPLMKWY